LWDALGRFLVPTQEGAPLPIGVVWAGVGELAHQVVLGFDIDEEVPRPAAERRGMFHQRGEQRHAPLPFDVVNRGGVLRAELLGQREDRLPLALPQLPPQYAKSFPIRHDTLRVSP
jgi:hypothetical protein